MKRAYHRLLLPDGTVRRMVVCKFNEKGEITEWHQFTAEEAGVEWVGGEIKL